MADDPRKQAHDDNPPGPREEADDRTAADAGLTGAEGPEPEDGDRADPPEPPSPASGERSGA